ncbi:MAG: decarboxylase [Bacteroidetes bacterium 4572_114]|nr:MAG: decarboxylase [Bacteroidetes bacterium 4572_114]
MNIIGRFAKNLVGSVADAGEKFLDLRRLRGTPTQSLLKLCDDLISHKGVASGIALAREMVYRYQSLKSDEKLNFLLELNQQMGPNLLEIRKAAGEFSKTPDEKNLVQLSRKIKSNRQKLFSRMNMAPNGTQAIVALRKDILDFIPSHPGLKAIDDDLRVLLTSWFNPGFLTLKKIDWDTEASILEKIILYEAVHDIKDWNDLKTRLVADRVCFAYFHPALEDEPLIFVEVALTKGITGSIQSIIESGEDTEEGDTAIFYSINNCQQGLRKIPLGNFLIKMVVTELATELPAIKTYCTLSPIPGFADWLRRELKSGNSKLIQKKERKILRTVEEVDWYKDKNRCNELQKPLMMACAKYLVEVKKNGKPLNSVAKFHFGNGAQLYRINWMGNTSAHGLAESFGLMVNYLYDLKHIETNHEAYVQRGDLAVAKSIRAII